VRLGRSKGQILAILAALMLVLVALWRAGLPTGLGLALGFAVVVSAIHQLMLIAGFLPQSILTLRYTGTDWWLTLASGDTVRAELTGLRIVLPWLVSVHFKTARGCYSCVVLRDQVTKTEHRRLRVAILQQPIESGALGRWRNLAIARWYQYRIHWVRRLGRIIQGVM
jgi:hypothetical protein